MGDKMQKVSLHKYGFHYVEDPPSSEELRKYYQEKYYQEEKGNYRKKYDAPEEKYIRLKIEQKLKLIERINPSVTKTLIDIGCGEGFTLSYFKRNGWNVTGLDYSEYGCNAMNPDCLENLITGDVFENIQKLISSQSKFGVIWMSNVLEHVLDPVQLLLDCRALISQGGILVVQVPNDFSELQKQLVKKQKTNEFWIAIPDHLSYFNRESLEKTCSECGWDTKSIIADFPIDWYLVNDHSNYITDRSKGHQAHHSRIELEIKVHESGIEKANAFYSALADVGMGRQITGFFRLK